MRVFTTLALIVSGGQHRSSAMLKSGVSVEETLKTAGWSKATTFQKLYNKPLERKGALQKTKSILHYFASKETAVSRRDML